MVYEARAGQTFLLGASTWRIEEITRDRVLVSPAPGVPGRGAVLEGRGRRPAVRARPEDRRRLARAVGARRRRRRSSALRDEYHLDERAARNLLTFLREQARRDRRRPVRPHDRRRALPRRDRRLARLHPHAVRRPRARAVGDGDRRAAARGARHRGAVDLVGRRDRAALPRGRRAAAGRGPAWSTRPRSRISSSPRWARPRSSARASARTPARALLIPRRRPGERTPLWQQRLKAQSLLQVARKYGSFPVILETYRECLQDVFDLPALRRLLQGLQTRELDLVEVETQSASPYSASLLFDYIATYMYEDDTPPAERRAQALSLDRDLLRELLGQEELRDLLDADAVDEVERQLRGTPTTPDQLHDQLRIRGDLRAGEYDAALAEPLLAERRAVLVRIAGEERLIAAEDAGRYRDALGAMPPSGLPDAFLEGGPDSLRQLVLRYAKGRGPFTTGEANERFGRDVGELLAELERDELLVRGELRPGGSEREWCDPDVLRRLRRASLAALRREVEPVEQEALARFLPGWHGIDRRASLREALVPLQALPLPVALWESEVLPRRVPGYRPEHLDALTRERRGRLGRRRAGPRRALLPRGRSGARPGAGTPRARRAPSTTRCARALDRGALFWLDLLEETGARGRDRAARALGSRLGGRGDERRLDAAAGGAPLRRSRRPSAGRAASRAAASQGATATAGRWSRDRAAVRRRARPARARRAAARAAGDRHARRRSRRGHSRRLRRRLRGAARARDARPLPPRLLRRGPRRRAVRARRRRRAAARAARPAARRATRSCSPPPIRRSRTAPRCRGRSVPARARRASPGAYVVSLGGEPVLYVERGGRSLVPLRDPDADVAASRARRARRARAGRAADAARGRALRRRAGRRDARRCSCSSRRASSPGRGAPFYGRSRATISAAGSARASAAFVPAHRLIASASPAARAAARSGAVRWWICGYADGASGCARMKRSRDRGHADR